MIFAETCELEETTIERMIRSLYTHHTLHGFEESHFERSTRYIRETSGMGQHNLNLLTSSCEDIYKTLVASDAELKKSLDQICGQVEKLKQADLDVLRALGLELDKAE